MAENSTLNLSAWQFQAVADIGLDAWYLAPLMHTESPEERQHAQLIENLVDAIDVPSKPVESAPQMEAPAPKLAPQPVAKVVEKMVKQTTQRRVSQPPPAIQFNTSTPTTQDDTHTQSSTFTLSTQPAYSDWDNLSRAIQQLTTDSTHPVYNGKGEKNAQELLILPAPLPTQVRHDAEQQLSLAISHNAHQLLDEILASIKISPQQVYCTHLLKQADKWASRVSPTTHAAQLGLLASELALVAPKRIWLFGSEVCQTVLGTQTHLAILSQGQYKLTFTGEHHTLSVPIVCLPDPDYLLALPAEKGKVWQCIKSLSVVP